MSLVPDSVKCLFLKWVSSSEGCTDQPHIRLKAPVGSFSLFSWGTKQDHVVKHIQKPTAERRWGSSCGVLTRLQATVAKHPVPVVGLRFFMVLTCIGIWFTQRSTDWASLSKGWHFQKATGGTKTTFIVGIFYFIFHADFAVLILTFISSRSASHANLCLHHCWTSGNCSWKLLQKAEKNNWELGERYCDV